MSKHPKTTKKPKTERKPAIRDLEPTKDSKGGATFRDIPPITKRIDKPTPTL